MSTPTVVCATSKCGPLPSRCSTVWYHPSTAIPTMNHSGTAIRAIKITRLNRSNSSKVRSRHLVPQPPAPDSCPQDEQYVEAKKDRQGNALSQEGCVAVVGLPREPEDEHQQNEDVRHVFDTQMTCTNPTRQELTGSIDPNVQAKSHPVEIFPDSAGKTEVL